MKLSKSLLSAVMIGIAVHAVSSCKKDKPAPDKKTPPVVKQTPPYNCPGCGMG
jgi:hypothetical protein